MSNPRPRLNVFERHLACTRVRAEGWSVTQAAAAVGVSRQTVHKWLRRFSAEGLAGLGERSSRPWRMPRLTRIDLTVRICSERLARRWGPHRLSYLLGLARSTIYAVLRRAELSRLGALVVKRLVLRSEWPAPGDLVHLDTKKLGRIHPDGGWRNLGRRVWNAKKSRVYRRASVGYEYCHVAVDDHSRWSQVLVAASERSESAVAALERMWSAYLRHGVRIKRVLTDNGSCYRSRDFGAACARLRIAHWRTKPYTPRTNGKAERFIKTLLDDWAYARLYRSSAERLAALPTFLQEYSHRPSIALAGHAPICRFVGVNNVSGNCS